MRKVYRKKIVYFKKKFRKPQKKTGGRISAGPLFLSAGEGPRQGAASGII
jgi:hypothetical protein